MVMVLVDFEFAERGSLYGTLYGPASSCMWHVCGYAILLSDFAKMAMSLRFRAMGKTAGMITRAKLQG